MDELVAQKEYYELKLKKLNEEINSLRNKNQQYRETLFEINRYANGHFKMNDIQNLEHISDLACRAIREEWINESK